jgi:hypothetical protein
LFRKFKEEEIAIKACRGKSINCFGLFSRTNRFIYNNSEKNINADFILETFDTLSFNTIIPTVIVLDNTRVHTQRTFENMAKYGVGYFLLTSIFATLKYY